MVGGYTQKPARLTTGGYRRMLRKLLRISREWKDNPMTTPRLKKYYSDWAGHYSVLAFNECSYIIMNEVRRKYLSNNMEPVQKEKNDGNI